MPSRGVHPITKNHTEGVFILLGLVFGGFLAYLFGAAIMSAVPGANPESRGGAVVAVLAGGIVILVIGGLLSGYNPY
jgi:hypothetical protein